MDNSKVYVGLDIGTTSIKTVICENVKGQLKVVGVGVEPSDGLNRGVIVDIDKTTQAISAAVDIASQQSGVKVSDLVVGLPANYLQTKNVHGMITIASQGQSHEIINDDVIDVARATLAQNVPAEREVIDLVPQEFTVDGFNGIKDPRGMVGVRLEMQALLYSGPTTIVHNTKKAVEKAGFKIRDMVVSPIATGFNLLSDGEQDFGTLVIDMGGGQTTASIIHDHQLKYTYVDPEGGYYITKDISTVLNTSLRNAEQLKKDHGYADSRMAHEDVQLEVAKVGQSEPGTCSEKYLAEIIEARVRQIFKRISDRLEAIRAPKLPGGVILIGGVSAMPGVKELATEYFAGTVKQFVPQQMGVRHAGYDVVLSLAMYESRLNDVERLIKQIVREDDGVINQPQAHARKAAPKRPNRNQFVHPQPKATSRPAPSENHEQVKKRQRNNAPKKSGGIRGFFSNFFD